MPKPGKFEHRAWSAPTTLKPQIYVCGYCGAKVSSEKGYKIINLAANKPIETQHGGVFICPSCNGPTYFPPDESRQVPGSAFGNDVAHVPAELENLYSEARSCIAIGNYTASVLVARKMLMNVAVQQKAAENLKFVEYVDFLSDEGFVPPNGKHWVDHIRKKGNEANHEISLMTERDAKELIVFLEMLLKFIYEFPNLVPRPSTP